MIYETLWDTTFSSRKFGTMGVESFGAIDFELGAVCFSARHCRNTSRPDPIEETSSLCAIGYHGGILQCVS